MTDIIAIIQALAALGFVLGLIWVCAWTMRRYAPGLLQTGPARRLQIVESLPLDSRHRAVLLRCDARHHLLVLGDGKTVLIDRDIPSPPPVALKDSTP